MSAILLIIQYMYRICFGIGVKIRCLILNLIDNNNVTVKPLFLCLLNQSCVLKRPDGEKNEKY